MIYNGNIKIVDFGLSCQYRKGELLSKWCGSLNYTSPEIFNRQRYDPLKIDIWGCGIVLYFMMCRAIPFEDKDEGTLINKIKTGNYSVPSFLTEDAKNLLKGIL